jgi:hypothetical protein
LLESKQAIRWLEVLKSEFFAVIKKSCGVSVAKYWLTGVLPAFRDGISPLTATNVISFNEQYHSLCGLTQEDVNAIVKQALLKNERALPERGQDFLECKQDFLESEQDLLEIEQALLESEQAYILDSLKRWYNGYMFSPTMSSSKNSTLYNPQLVFVHLQNAVSHQALCHINEANAVHTAIVLSVVGETGPVTISDLIDMLYANANASILTEFSFIELMQEQEKWSKDLTWSLLYHLGIVTFSKDSSCLIGTQSLCVPNKTMFHLVSPRTSCLGGC